MKKQDSDQKKIEELVRQADDWKSKALRALADYQNLEKRISASRNDERMYAAERVLKELLPVGDILTKAAGHIQDQGLNLAVKEFWKVVAEQGVTKIETEGRKFNPAEMECVEVAPGEEEVVLAEVAPGYKLHERVIRVAKVKVGKAEIDAKVEELAKEELNKAHNKSN